MRVSVPIFIGAFLLLTLGAHLYLWRAARRWIGPAHPRARRALDLGLLGFGLLFFAFFIAHRVAAIPMPVGVTRVAYVWLGIAFFLLLGFVALDLFRWLRGIRGLRRAPPPARPLDESRRTFLARSAVFGAATLAAPTYGAFRAFGPPDVTETEVPLPRLPPALRGFSIVQLTDLHVGPWIRRETIEALVEQTQALKPDAVVITGDLVDGPVSELAPHVAPLSRLVSKYGTFFVTGNHDYYSGADAWCDHLRSLGVRVLRNERVSVGEPGASFDLAGVDDWGAKGGHDLGAALGGRDPARACILLAHQPRGFEQAAAMGVGLQLSGHTHGGQLWPWTLAVGAVYPYFAGAYRLGDATIYVSRGTGFWGPPVRLGAPPELARFVLR